MSLLLLHMIQQRRNLRQYFPWTRKTSQRVSLATLCSLSRGYHHRVGKSVHDGRKDVFHKTHCVKSCEIVLYA